MKQDHGQASLDAWIAPSDPQLAEGRLATVMAAPAPAMLLAVAGLAPDPLDRFNDRLRYRDHVRVAAAEHRLPPRLLESMIAAESGFNPRARSRAGAAGLMQLMPRTARHLGVQNPYDPADNIDGGARYMRELLERFNGNVTLALAAYNAGPTAVSRTRGVPRNRETINYVRKIRGFMGGHWSEYHDLTAPADADLRLEQYRHAAGSATS